MSGPGLDTLYYGDCLDWMRRWDNRCVDLIYLDPPFNSKANYNLLYTSERGGDAQYRAFSDTWTWDEAAADRFALFEAAPGRAAHDAIVGLHRVLGPSGMLAYLTYMAERLEHMQRILRPTGSIYLHCDPTASHYLKLVMDAVFGAANFRSEIVWKRSSAHNDAKQGRQQHGRIHDIILFYTKSDRWTWNPVYTPYDEEYVRRFYRHVEGGTGRRYRLSDISGRGGAAKGNPSYEIMGVTRHWAYSRERMQNLIEQGRIMQSAPGRVPAYKRYLDEMPGVTLQDIWTDIGPIAAQAKERIGYPTQKPAALLERMIKASSNPGDIVCDPFCGCGTTIAAARKLRRRWVGIDISSFAIDLIRERRLRDPTVPTKGIPLDMASARKLAAEQPFSFESWAVTRLPGFAPNTRQVADGGVDGRAMLATKPDNHDSRLALAQIKGGRFSLSALRDFIGVTDRDKAALGCFVTLEPVSSPAARSATANAGKITVSGYEYRRMQLWPISDYFEGRMPSIPVMTDPYSGKPLDQIALL